MLKKITIIAASMALLAGCASDTYQPSGNMNSLQGLQQMNSQGYIGPFGGGVSNVSAIRFMAIKDTAMSVGARAGLAWRSKQVDAILSSDSAILDQAYDFYGLMLPHNILPPVLQEARNTLNLANPNTLRLASQVFQIKSQARFVTAVPTWRDYIWMNYPEPDRPDNSLLPESPEEQAVWNEYVQKGWNEGISQANSIFAENLARLNTDYEGMVLYRELYQQNMVSAPYIAKVNLGITGSGSEMSVNDRVLRITALPQLNLKGNTWKPVLIPDPLAAYKLNLLKQVYPKTMPRSEQAKLYVK